MNVSFLRAMLVLFAPFCVAAAQTVTPLPRAHAHNDYEHERPLLDALAHGFCSVEADIWLVDGELLVAHDRDKVDPARTLENLYLAPLQERVNANGGRVYPSGPEFILLIDIKSPGEETYAALRKVLERYAPMLTTFTHDELTIRAVRVIISGSRPREMMMGEDVHYAAYDGRLDDLGAGASAAFIPLVSSSWSSAFEWRGRGPISVDERERLHHLVTQAHDEGRKVRFWAIPHSTEFWDELLSAGVDLINADDLAMLRDYLLERTAP